MNKVDNVAIGLQSYDLCAIREYAISTALDLGSIFFDKSISNDDETDADTGVPPAAPQADLNNFFSALADMFLSNPTLGMPGGPGSPLGVGADIASGQSAPTTDRASYPSSSLLNLQPQFSSSIDHMTGNELYGMSLTLPSVAPSALPVAPPAPDTSDGGSMEPSWESTVIITSDAAIAPNPWPCLKSLALWNMPALKHDLISLLRTVKDSLKTLTLINVYYRQPVHENIAATGTIAPGQVVMPSSQPWHNGAVFNTVAPTAQDMSQLGGHTDQIIDPMSFDNDGLPETCEDGLAATSSSLNPPNTYMTGPSGKEQWYETADTMSELLRLDHCDIQLSPEDAEKLHQKLTASVEGLDKPRYTMNQFVTEYVLSGEGVGLSIAVAEAVKLERGRRP